MPEIMTHTKAYDLLTIGMRLAFMADRGLIDIDTSTIGEDEMANFAWDLSNKFPAYSDTHDFGIWDEYIETAILERYGRKS